MSKKNKKRTDNTMSKIKKGQKDNERSTNHYTGVN
jgi:hypothetical protein